MIFFAFGKVDCLVMIGLHSSVAAVGLSSCLAFRSLMGRTCLYCSCGTVWEKAVLENEGRDPRSDSWDILVTETFVSLWLGSRVGDLWVTRMELLALAHRPTFLTLLILIIWYCGIGKLPYLPRMNPAA
jgi:hypothetical protein